MNLRIFLISILLTLMLTLYYCSGAREVENPETNDIGISGDGGQDVMNDSGIIDERLVDYVNVFIGTGGVGFGVGSMLPGATAPFSMMRLSPDTAMSNGAVPFYHCAGYYYEDQYIVGFSHNHLPGVGVVDEGNILFMPITKLPEDMIYWTNYRSPLSHDLEKASPGYYSVYLPDKKVMTEFTVRLRSGMHRYTFEDRNSISAIVVNMDAAAALGYINVVDERLVVDTDKNAFYGYAKTVGDFASRYGGLKIYFYAIPDKKIESFKIFSDNKQVEGSSADGDNVVGLISFGSADVVKIKVGISYVDIDGARRNLEEEMPDFDFEKYRSMTEEEWESLLSTIRIKTNNKRDRRIFYTAVYHLFQLPTIFMDVDKRYRGFDGQIHTAEGFVYYTDFSLWDTYRTFHPLISLLFPSFQKDFNISLLKMYEQGGYLPRWPMGIGESGSMVGESDNIVLADSVMRGVTDWDIEKGYEAMLKSADKPKDPNSYYGGRDAIEDYINLGYVPADKSSGSVSKTQEYTYDDYAIAYLAKYLNKPDYERFSKRSMYYKNLFHPEKRFFLPKNSDGSWIENVVETAWSDYYVEGDAWQYRFFVPYDSEGLMTLFGGREGLFAALNELFIKSIEEVKNEPTTLIPRKYYWQSNEPCILIPFIYCDLGDCNSTNKYLRWIISVFYKDSPDGLPGNDDGGTMSAWYIMSSTGLLMLPVKEYYLIGTPLFEEVEIRLRDRILKVKTQNFSRDNYQVKAVYFNGKEIPDFRIPHSSLIEGGEVVVKFQD